MGFGEKRGTYWRGRYKIAPGQYGTVVGPTGATLKFATKREAKQAADEHESQVRAGTWRDPALGRVTFGEYVNRWFPAQDLAPSTMQSYRRYIEGHLLPEFEDTALADIRSTDVAAWEKRERESYEPTSVRTWRAVLHLILADAVDEGLLASNPATKRRGRGKRAGRSSTRGPEKAVTSPLGALLIAERLALLSGRDDEFVACVLKAYTGMRWGEVVGLEAEFVRPRAVRVEWQLYELDTGELLRCPPKDDSHRTIDAPPWLLALLNEHIARTGPRPCECHDRTYVFRGRGIDRSSGNSGGMLTDVARRAGVSAGTVSNVLNHPERVSKDKRLRVEAAVADVDFKRNAPVFQPAAHWRRNGFATWMFQPAATGWYPKKAPLAARPVPLLSEPWPGIPVRGRNANGRAGVCWTPIAPRLTPHGLRHSHRTAMEETGTEKVLMDERMGHADGSISARYAHVTEAMRLRLCDNLTALWEAALESRRALSPQSPVAALDRLLRSKI